jgi:release factor glutamine methyltransferase
MEARFPSAADKEELQPVVTNRADDLDEPLLRLGQALRDAGYRFVTPTPETHRRVAARSSSGRAQTLVDAFGWSRPFEAGFLPDDLFALLKAADAIKRMGALFKSRVRFSSIGEQFLFAHSAYPTVQEDAVFFGPDTYRFARLITTALSGRPRRPVACAVDIGCGSGAGGLLASRCLATPPQRLVLADVSPKALRFAGINAALNGIAAETVESDVLNGISCAVDLIVTNPPYLVDSAHRLYRDGGGAFGFDLSLRILRESLTRLAPDGGLLVLYTGSAIVGGEDLFRTAAERVLAERGDVRWSYGEIDPDVFGEELDTPAYAEVDRIAAVGLIVET